MPRGIRKQENTSIDSFSEPIIKSSILDVDISSLKPLTPKFRPERPIYLNKANTGLNREEVVIAVEALRALGWLCVVNEEIEKPIHLSFNNEKMFQEFKRSCKDLSIVLKSKIIKPDEEIIEPEVTGLKVHGAEESTYISSSGELKIESPSEQD